LNNEDLDVRKKEAIIQKTETKIPTLTEIETKEIEDLLFENSKLQPNWTDIISRFVSDENVMSNPVIAFLNNIENVEFLAKIKIDKEKPDKKTVDKFLEALLLCEKINNNSYAQILKSISALYIYNSLSFEKLLEDKVTLLIQNNILELNSTNYTLLRDNFPNLHIDLIEKRHFKLTEELVSELLFDNDDITLILKSSILPIKNKQMILDVYDESEIINSSEILNLLRDMALNQNFKTSKDILMAILTKTKDVELRIKLYNNKNQELQPVDTENFINSLPEPYSNIAEKGKRPLLPNTETNKLFVRKLASQSYISKCEIEEKGIRISTFKK
jgi:hypothetical protein